MLKRWLPRSQVPTCTLGLAVFMAGCATPSVKTFEGERDISQIAILKGGLAGQVMSRFHAYVHIDGAKTLKRVSESFTANYPTEIQLEPGRYQILMRCNTADGSYGFPSVTAEFAAGMTYEMFCEVPQYLGRKVAAYVSQSYPSASFRQPPAIATAPGLKAVGAALAGPVASLKTYAPPSGLTGATGATLRGSHTPVSFPAADQFSYVLSVGGQLVAGGKEAHSAPLLVPAGAQQMRLAWEQGGLFVQQAVRISLNAGEEYVVKHEKPDRMQVRLWIEEVKTGRKVGQDIRMGAAAPRTDAERAPENLTPPTASEPAPREATAPAAADAPPKFRPRRSGRQWWETDG